MHNKNPLYTPGGIAKSIGVHNTLTQKMALSGKYRKKGFYTSQFCLKQDLKVLFKAKLRGVQPLFPVLSGNPHFLRRVLIELGRGVFMPNPLHRM